MMDVSGGGGPPPKPRYVPTEALKKALIGREADAVRAIGIPWHGRGHIRCPYPGHDDRNPSWRLTEQGLAICTCSEAHSVIDVAMKFSGLSFEDAKLAVAEAIGRQDLIVDPAAKRKKAAANGDDRGGGITLEQYAEAKKLPVSRLLDWGLREQTYLGLPAIRMPYHRDGGGEPPVKFRLALEGQFKTRWRKGDKPCLYGHWFTPTFRQLGWAVIVEGESDCHTLWLHDMPALGLPGANLWSEERDAPVLDGIGVIFIIVEPDKGGEATLRWLARSSVASRARLVHMPAEVKDPSKLFAKICGGDSTAFVAKFNAMLAAAPAFAGPDFVHPKEPLEELIETFNSKYAVVNESGQVLVYERVFDPIMKRQVLVRFTFADLRKAYLNQTLTVETRGVNQPPKPMPIGGSPIPSAGNTSAVSCSTPRAHPRIAGICGAGLPSPPRPATGRRCASTSVPSSVPAPRNCLIT
jgi:hypothetical protein